MPTAFVGRQRRQARLAAALAGAAHHPRNPTNPMGVRAHVADRWYPSSKTCSDCGAVKAKLPLRVRVFNCDECGLVLDRDLNAARNLAKLVTEVTHGTSTASCVGTLNTPAGNPRKTTLRGAAGTATGRPAPVGAGQPGSRKAAGQDTLLHVS